MQENLGVHEALELHEILSFKSLCVTKASVMQMLVSDGELKDLMQASVKRDASHIEDLKKFMKDETK